MAVPRPAVDSFLPNFTHRYTATRPLVAYIPPQHSRAPPKTSLRNRLCSLFFFIYQNSILFFFPLPSPPLYPPLFLFIPPVARFLSVENRVVALNFRRVRTRPVFGVALHFRGSFSPRRVRVMRFSIADPAISFRDLDRNLLATSTATLLFHACMHSSSLLSVNLKRNIILI